MVKAVNLNSEGYVEVVVVDREELYCPGEAGWKVIRDEHSFRGNPLGAEGILWSYVTRSQARVGQECPTHRRRRLKACATTEAVSGRIVRRIEDLAH